MQCNALIACFRHSTNERQQTCAGGSCRVDVKVYLQPGPGRVDLSDLHLRCLNGKVETGRCVRQYQSSGSGLGRYIDLLGESILEHERQAGRWLLPKTVCEHD